MTTLTSEQLNEVLHMGLEETWEAFTILLIDYEELEADYDRIRYGYTIPFDIYDYIDHRYIEKPKQGAVLINGNIHHINDFRTEIEKRRSMMKKAILDNIRPDQVITSRLKEA